LFSAGIKRCGGINEKFLEIGCIKRVKTGNNRTTEIKKEIKT